MPTTRGNNLRLCFFLANELMVPSLEIRKMSEIRLQYISFLLDQLLTKNLTSDTLYILEIVLEPP